MEQKLFESLAKAMNNLSGLIQQFNFHMKLASRALDSHGKKLEAHTEALNRYVSESERRRQESEERLLNQGLM